jgi:hypothetical protein
MKVHFFIYVKFWRVPRAHKTPFYAAGWLKITKKLFLLRAEDLTLTG